MDFLKNETITVILADLFNNVGSRLTTHAISL